VIARVYLEGVFSKSTTVKKWRDVWRQFWTALAEQSGDSTFGRNNSSRRLVSKAASLPLCGIAATVQDV
jgi:hypothetical protein